MYWLPYEDVMFIKEVDRVRKDTIQLHIYQNTGIADHTPFFGVFICFERDAQRAADLAKAVNPAVLKIPIGQSYPNGE